MAGRISVGARGPSAHAPSQENQPALKIAELVNGPAFASLTESQPLGHPVLARRLYGFGGEASRCRRLVLRLRNVRSNAERPGKAVCVVLVPGMR
jgi:hypothetical protein